MKRATVTLATALLLSVCAFAEDKNPETPHYKFAQEYLREMSALEQIRENSENDTKTAGGGDLSSMIYASSRYKQELITSVNMLKAMHLNPPLDSAAANLAGLLDQEIVIHSRLIEIATLFMGGPQPGRDYAKLAAEVPQLRAAKDGIEETIFKMSPLVVLSLADVTGPKDQPIARWTMTCGERKELLNTIGIFFSKKLESKNQNSYVAAAGIIRDGLKKPLKCSDEP